VDRTNKEGIKRVGAGPGEDCSVSLVFELGGVQYHVSRALRGRSLKPDAQLIANGEVLATGERSVTSQVEKILGMDYHAFFLSVFTRQKDLAALSALAPAERKAHIIRMLDLDVLQDVIDDIKRDKKDEENKLEFMSNQLLRGDRRPKRQVLEEEKASHLEEMKRLDQDLKKAEKEVQRLEVELRKAEKVRNEVAEKEKEYRERERRLSAKQTELDGLMKQRSDLEKDITSLEDRLRSLPMLKKKKEEYDVLLRKKDEMEDRRGAHEERKGLLKSLKRVEEEIAKAKNQFERCSREQRELKDPRSSLLKVTNNLASLESKIQERKDRVYGLQADVRNLKEVLKELEGKRQEITSLGPASVCPTCQRPLGDQHEHLVLALDDRMKKVGSSISSILEEIVREREERQTLLKRKEVLEERRKKLQADELKCSKLDACLDQIAANLETLEKERVSSIEHLDSLGDIDFDESEYDAVKKRLRELRAAVERFQKLSGEATRLLEMKARMDDLCTSIELLEAEVIGMKADLEAVGYKEGDLKSAQDMYVNSLSSLGAGRERIYKILSDIDHVRDKIKEKEKAIAEIEELERTIEGCTKRVQELVTLEQVMGDFKQNLMERITPTLSDIASELFDTMTNSRYGGLELDDDYEIHIYDGEAKYPLSRFSGGESDLANLCLRLAISRVLADRSGNDINFLILDEIFGSQDQVRKRAIMETLNRLEKRFHQIILITHIDDTKDMMSNVVTVKESNDGTSELVPE